MVTSTFIYFTPHIIFLQPNAYLLSRDHVHIQEDKHINGRLFSFPFHHEFT